MLITQTLAHGFTLLIIIKNTTSKPFILHYFHSNTWDIFVTLKYFLSVVDYFGMTFLETSFTVSYPQYLVVLWGRFQLHKLPSDWLLPAELLFTDTKITMMDTEKNTASRHVSSVPQLFLMNCQDGYS